MYFCMTAKLSNNTVFSEIQIYSYSMYLDVLRVFISVYYTHAWYPWKPEKSITSPGPGVTGGRESPCE